MSTELLRPARSALPDLDGLLCGRVVLRTAAEVEQLVMHGESEHIEFKKTTGELKSAGRTLSAFLNGQGGLVLFGVTPQGRLIGQEVTDTTQQDVATVLRQIDPAIKATLHVVDLHTPGKRIIAVSVNPSPTGRPYLFDGRAFMRIGTATSLMPREQMEQHLIERSLPDRRWESQPAVGYTMKDLDQDAIRMIVQRGTAARRIAAGADDDVPTLLDRLGLMIAGQITNAAVALFAKTVTPMYPQCHIHMARFRGVMKGEMLDERPPLYGHAFRLLEEASLFLERHIPVAARVVPGRSERVETPLLPLTALREALHNALCHRDYVQPGGGITVEVYDDRVEIWNVGRLPEGWTVDTLKRPHRSRPPNEIIANVFYLGNFIEHWGRGTTEMVRTCLAEGHPEPEFLIEGGNLGVRFVPRIPFGQTAALENKTAGLSERQLEILRLLAANDLAPATLAARLHPPISLRTLRRETGVLEARSLIGRRGPNRDHILFLRSIS